MSPHTALRIGLTQGSAALVVRRPDGPVHLHTWSTSGAGPRPRGVLARGARPVCGRRAKRWYLATSVLTDARLCGGCATWAYGQLTRDVDVLDAELPALVRGATATTPCSPLWALERTRAHVITPWRGLQITAGLDGRPVMVKELFAQVREQVRAARLRRRQDEAWQQQAVAEGEPA